MLAGAAAVDVSAGSVAHQGVGERLLEFVRPIIGFAGATRYALRPLGEQLEPFGSLVSLDREDLSFVVAPPAMLFDDYVIEVPEGDCRDLGLAEPSDTGVLVIVRSRGVPVPVVNLMAPIVVNRRTGAAAQVVLEDSGYGLMVPVDAGTARPH